MDENTFNIIIAYAPVADRAVIPAVCRSWRAWLAQRAARLPTACTEYDSIVAADVHQLYYILTDEDRLFCAICRYGATKLLKLALRDMQNITPAQHAELCISQHFNVLIPIAMKSPKIDLTYHDNVILSQAVLACSRDTIKYILDHSAHIAPNDSLVLACALGAYDVFDMLLEDERTRVDYRGYTFVSMIATTGDIHRLRKVMNHVSMTSMRNDINNMFGVDVDAVIASACAAGTSASDRMRVCNGVGHCVSAIIAQRANQAAPASTHKK